MNWKIWRSWIGSEVQLLHKKVDKLPWDFRVCATCGILYTYMSEAGDYHDCTTVSSYGTTTGYILTPEADVAKCYCPQCRPAAREKYKAEQWAKDNPTLARQCMSKHTKQVK